LKEAETSAKQVEKTNMNNGLFLIKPANEWMKGAIVSPIPKMIFSKK
jgi:hypothetical protein